ncbi:hypothetical protein HA402_004080 [Bradysia odoriphaga]|nr:hypothetical protein HA402_004080 [Bradysia odoriphaga]
MIKHLVWFSLFSCVLGGRLTELYRWKQMKYVHLMDDNDMIVFPDQHDQSSEYSRQQEYIPYNNVPMSVAHFKDKLIVTVARRKPGIPSTLNYVSTKLPRGSSPTLRPYPDLRTNELHPNLQSDSSRIVSVYRPRVDDCGRLWFVDTGTLQYSLPKNPRSSVNIIQRPSIWVIDLNTDKVISRYEIPESLLKHGHGLVSITPDVAANMCDDAYAYIADLLTFQLHVYSLRKNKMWSFKHDSFKFEQLYADFDVDGFQYTWRDGIFSIALGNREADGYRSAYYHPMASLSEYQVSTRVLQNEEAATGNNRQNDFMKIGVRGAKSQCTMHSMDRHTGVVMFAQVARNGVSCWNSRNPLNENQIAMIDSDDMRMIYPVDLSIDRDGIMWMVTNTMQRFIYGKLDTDAYNFRIWKGNVSEVIKGTVCDVHHF